MTPNDFFEKIRPQIKEVMEAEGRVPMTAFFLWNKTSTIKLLPIPEALSNDASFKDLIQKVLRNFIQKEKPDLMILVMEVWMLKTKNQTEMDRIGPEGISEHPGRDEAVFVTGENAFGTTSWSAPISRDDSGKPTLGEFENLGTDIKGRFAHLFMTWADEVN